jgi:Na+-transporting methylmalonyl-CoA/oxaloacetate decarboxylase gamma subunit
LPEIVYVSLRYLFLALLFVFVFLVARVVYSELRPPESRPASKRAAAKAPRQRRKARLVMAGEKGLRKQASWELETEVVIGRAAECAVSVDDEFASNLHAKIYRSEGRYYVEDLGSTNGTYVNGRRINYPTELRGGDRVKIGRTEMEFRR